MSNATEIRQLLDGDATQPMQNALKYPESSNSQAGYSFNICTLADALDILNGTQVVTQASPVTPLQTSSVGHFDFPYRNPSHHIGLAQAYCIVIYMHRRHASIEDVMLPFMICPIIYNHAAERAPHPNALAKLLPLPPHARAP
jgi:hypothetical protein